MAKTKAEDYAKKHKAAMEKARAAAANMKNAHGADMGKATEAMKKMHSQYAGKAKEVMQKMQQAAAAKKPVSTTGRMPKPTATKPKANTGVVSGTGKKIVGATKANSKIGSAVAKTSGATKPIGNMSVSGTAKKLPGSSPASAKKKEY